MAQVLQDQPYHGHECMSVHLLRTRKHLKLAQQHIEEQVNENLQYGCPTFPRPFPRSPLATLYERPPLLPPLDPIKEEDESLMESLVFVEGKEITEEQEARENDEDKENEEAENEEEDNEEANEEEKENEEANEEEDNEEASEEDKENEEDRENEETENEEEEDKENENKENNEDENEEEESCLCLPPLPRKTVTFSETPGDFHPPQTCSEGNLALMRRPPPYQRPDNRPRQTQTHEKCLRVQQEPFERRHDVDEADTLTCSSDNKAMVKATGSCDPFFSMYQAVYILGCLMWTAVFIRLVTM